MDANPKTQLHVIYVVVPLGVRSETNKVNLTLTCNDKTAFIEIILKKYKFIKVHQSNIKDRLTVFQVSPKTVVSCPFEHLL